MINSIILVTGSIVGFIIAGLILALNPQLTERILWRFESFESHPTIRQRLYEASSYQRLTLLDSQTSATSILIIGDSHLERLNFNPIAGVSNFAIGGIALFRLKSQLASFSSLSAASQVVIGGGENDFLEGRSLEETFEAWRQIITLLPKSIRIICIGIPIGSGAKLDAVKAKFNAQVKQYCELNGHTFVSVAVGQEGAFKDGQFLADQIHLNAATNLRLRQIILETLSNINHNVESRKP